MKELAGITSVADQGMGPIVATSAAVPLHPCPALVLRPAHFPPGRGPFFALPIAAIIQAFLSTYSRRYDIIESDLTQVDKPKIPTTRPVQQ
jgi:hypothetical protein